MTNLETKEVSFQWYRDFFKRELDIVVSLIAMTHMLKSGFARKELAKIIGHS